MIEKGKNILPIFIGFLIFNFIFADPPNWDADGDGVTIIQQGSSWVFDPGDQNTIDDDGNGYIDDFIGWDV